MSPNRWNKMGWLSEDVYKVIVNGVEIAAPHSVFPPGSEAGAFDCMSFVPEDTRRPAVIESLIRNFHKVAGICHRKTTEHHTDRSRYILGLTCFHNYPRQLPEKSNCR